MFIGSTKKALFIIRHFFPVQCTTVRGSKIHRDLPNECTCNNDHYMEHHGFLIFVFWNSLSFSNTVEKCFFSVVVWWWQSKLRRDSKLVVMQSLLYNTETILKEKINHLQETTNRGILMTENLNEMFSIYMTKKVPNGRLSICSNPNTINICR